MFNIYRQEQNEQYLLQLQKHSKLQENIILEQKKKNNILATNYDKRVMSFLEKMSQKPFVIHDSIYKKEQKLLDSDNRRWLNASALHSLDSCSNEKVAQRYCKKQDRSILNETVEDIQKSNQLEIKILDSFNPKKLDSNKKMKPLLRLDSNSLKKTQKMYTERQRSFKREDKIMPNERLYFNGLKSLIVHQRMYDNEEVKMNVTCKAKNILEKCNIIPKRNS